jgi:hypothetical protein
MGRGYTTYITPQDVIIAMQPPVKAGRPDRQRALELQPEGESTLTFTAKVKATITTLPGMGIKFKWAADDDPNQVELQRATHTKRITNPEDSEQYVDVEVIDSITFKNSLGEVINYSLANA